jgi:hypothetical protein
MVGLVVMFSLAWRISGSQIIAAVAGICYTLLPTVINGAHEAKPHLAGAVLGLIAIDLALRAIESGDRRWAIAAGASCGAAGGMVLSGWLAIGVLPVMVFFMRGKVPLRGDGSTELAEVRYAGKWVIFVSSLVTAILVYAAFNPYVIAHLLGDRTVLKSNLGNSAAMYQAPASINGFFRGTRLLLDGGSTVIFFGMWAITLDAIRKKPIAWLLMAGTIPMLCVFLIHATGKPGEYARFALPADLLLVLGAALGMGVISRPVERLMMGVVLCLMLLPLGASYHFVYGRESSGESTRLMVAERLQQLSAAGAVNLAIDAEPAPYVLPPVDLFKWKIVLLPRGTSAADADVRIDAVDAAGADSSTVSYIPRPMLLPTPISWAGKPFRIETRSDGAVAAKGRR